jgi:hypothetical protein
LGNLMRSGVLQLDLPGAIRGEVKKIPRRGFLPRGRLGLDAVSRAAKREETDEEDDEEARHGGRDGRDLSLNSG